MLVGRARGEKRRAKGKERRERERREQRAKSQGKRGDLLPNRLL